MLEERSVHEGGSNQVNDEFCAAIMDEDVGRIEEVSKTHGSNRPFQVRDGTPGKIFWKGKSVLPLHLAASHTRVKSVQKLLSLGADPELRDRFGQTTLHLLVSSWPRLCTPESKLYRNLNNALINVHRRAETCLRLLCEHGVDVNTQVKNESQETALHLSVRHTALSAVSILTSFGANTNAVDSTGMTPLHMAAGILHKDLIMHLVGRGADINMGVKHTGNTPLHLAVAATAIKSADPLKDDIGCVSELLEHGAEPDPVNAAGLTPLQEACCWGSERLVDLLLERGANINKLSQRGENCLFLYLSRRPNVKNSSLLVKLLSLTSPLTVYNHRGQLPPTLTLPCFARQREQLLKLIQQPRELQDICKIFIYLKHVRSKTDKLKTMLPERLRDFVFHYWKNVHSISFLPDGEHDSSQNSFHDTT